jgi:hypothetical protein
MGRVHWRLWHMLHLAAEVTLERLWARQSQRLMQWWLGCRPTPACLSSYIDTWLPLYLVIYAPHREGRPVLVEIGSTERVQISDMATGFCADCFKGTLRGDVEPAGTVETINGLPTYVARPAADQQPLGVVVIISDAFGWELLNTRALADVYARRGQVLVYVPDFLQGIITCPPLEPDAIVQTLRTPRRCCSSGW